MSPVQTVSAVLRRQLDQQLGAAALLRGVVAPDAGWVTTIRQALGLTLRDVADRLAVSRQAIGELERAERRGTITVGKLRELATALDCDVVVALVPRRPLAAMVEERERADVAAMRARVAHTMGLEAQREGVDVALEEDASAPGAAVRLPGSRTASHG